MKKIFCAVVLVNLIVGGVFAQSPEQITAVIRELTGEVEIKHSGAPAFVPAKAGSEVAKDTIISTGFKSTAVIAVGNSVITVRPLTRLSLAEIQAAFGSEDVSVNLQTGRVKVDVKPPAGSKANFKVQSPSATASVRGTSFEFDTRRLKVLEGSVAFMGGNKLAISVPAGGESYVETGGTVADPVTVAEGDFQPPPPVGVESTSSAAAETTPAPTKGNVSVEVKYPKN